jgi:hypothetical protein
MCKGTSEVRSFYERPGMTSSVNAELTGDAGFLPHCRALMAMK